MTSTLTRPAHATNRKATRREYLVCPPRHFEVAYAINEWMQIDVPVDRELAMVQWENLIEIYRGLGHTVHVAEPADGLPDMVFAANCAVMVDGHVFGARFRHPERAAEAPAFRRWFADHECGVYHEPTTRNEGEGDFAPAGRYILAGTGFRTDPEAHEEAEAIFGKPVISLTLCDPAYYHLDVALFVLDDDNVAYYPAAFSQKSQRVLRTLYPNAIIVAKADAEAFGLNSISDGRNVVVAQDAIGLIEQLHENGYVPIPVDLSELRKAGGGAKCCTQEIRRGRAE